jgi:mono/diheme cytochrome c family protein
MRVGLPWRALGMTVAAAVAVSFLSARSEGTPVVRPASNGRSPQVNYMTQCQGCHLPAGQGRAGQVPSLDGQLQHFLATEEGRRFLIQVPGSANARLSDADLAAVLNWMVVTMSPLKAGEFEPYGAQEVERYRDMKLADIQARRMAIVAQFPRMRP